MPCHSSFVVVFNLIIPRDILLSKKIVPCGSTPKKKLHYISKRFIHNVVVVESTKILVLKTTKKKTIYVCRFLHLCEQHFS